MEEYVAINDVYYRRMFLPILLAILLFVACFLIIRESPGVEWTMPTAPNLMGGFLRAL